MIPETNKIYHGDCLSIIKSWPDCFVDLVVTSPPYNLGNAKKGSFYGGKQKGDEIRYSSYDDDMDDASYVEWQHSLINQLKRIIKPTGAIFYNHKPRVMDGVFDSRRRLVPGDIRQEIIWDRCGMVNFSGSFFAPQTERIFVIAGDAWKPNKESVGLGDIWRIPPEQNNPHPAPFPILLAKKIISSSSQIGQLVFDPFMGSGTTALASIDTKRDFIGCEIDEAYVKMANERLEVRRNTMELF